MLGAEEDGVKSRGQGLPVLFLAKRAVG